MGSLYSPLKQSTYYNKFYVDAIKRKSSTFEPGTPIRKTKTNTTDKNTVKMTEVVNNNQISSDWEVSDRNIIKPHIRKRPTDKTLNNSINNNVENTIINNSNINSYKINNNSNNLNTYNSNNSNNSNLNNTSKSNENNNISNKNNNIPNKNNNNSNKNNYISNNNSENNSINTNKNSNILNNNNSNKLNYNSNTNLINDANKISDNNNSIKMNTNEEGLLINSNNNENSFNNNSSYFNNKIINNKFNNLKNIINYSNSNQKLNNLNSSTDDFNPNDLNNFNKNLINPKELKVRTNKKKVRFNIKDPPDSRDHDDDTNNNNNNEKIEKHILLANKYFIEPYNLSKDLANTKCDITYAQLLDISPEARSELIKNLKLEKLKISNTMNIDENFIYNSEYNEIKNNNNFKEDDLGIVLASVDNIKNKLLVDSGSNLNLISVDYFNSLPGQYETVGVCHGRICEALGDDTVTDAIVIRLNVLINTYSFSANFCVIDHNTNYFDLLIGLKTIADNYLFIHPMAKTLCRFTSYDSFDIITPLLENQEAELISCFVKYINPSKLINTLNYNDNININKSNNFTTDTRNKQIIEPEPQIIENAPQEENLSPIEYIQSQNFQSKIEGPFKPNISKLLLDFIDIVPTSSKQLFPSNTFEEHLVFLKQVSEIFCKYEVKINTEKCCFFKEEVELFGHVAPNNGLKTINSKVNAVAKWLKPENISELRSFFGSVGYYRKIMNSVAMIAAPLYKLLRKNVPDISENTHQDSYNKIETLLYTDHKPLMGLFSNKEPDKIRHIRRCITISTLRIKILYEPGKRNYIADSLFRIKINENKQDIKNNNKENNKLKDSTTPHIKTSNNKKISSLKIKKNFNFKNFIFQKLREKWWYIDNLKFSKISNLFNDNMDSNKLQYNPNIWLNINFNKLKLNQNKLKLNQNKLKIFLIQLLQLKRNINKYHSNILANINSYIL